LTADTVTATWGDVQTKLGEETGRNIEITQRQTTTMVLRGDHISFARPTFIINLERPLDENEDIGRIQKALADLANHLSDVCFSRESDITINIAVWESTTIHISAVAELVRAKNKLLWVKSVQVAHPCSPLAVLCNFINERAAEIAAEIKENLR